MSTFWDTYYEKPIDEIPWSNTQADWFIGLVEQGHVTGTSALDVGCGLGAKAVFLAAHGFREVVGVDIAARAIEYARERAKETGVADVCSFYVHDASDLSFLPEHRTFDLVLDWATVHCIPDADRTRYATGLSDRVRTGGALLIRAFGADDGRDTFTEEVDGRSDTMHLFTEERIMHLYPAFRVIARNTSSPRTKSGLHFVELLLTKG